MRSNFERGPELIRASGGTEAQPWPKNTYPTGVYSWQRSSSNTTVQREKPAKATYANGTDYAVSELVNTRTLVYAGFGNWAPITDYLSVSANQTSVLSETMSADARAASRLRSKIKDQTWNAATTIGEAGKTIAFVASVAHDLRHAWQLARRGDILGLADFAHVRDSAGKRRFKWPLRIGSAWVAWRYAVRPLMYDLGDMLQEFHNSGVRPRVIKVYASATENVGKTMFSGQVQGQDALTRRTGTVKVAYVAYYEQSGTVSLTPLGLTNFPALLWELTPWSFVIDKFIPIGRFLSGLDATMGINYLGGYRMEKHNWGETANHRGGTATSYIRSYSRSKASIPNQPLPSWSPPWTKPADKQDIPALAMDALALLAQTVSGRRDWAYVKPPTPRKKP